MRVVIITNFNGIGLETEFNLLSDFLSAEGHDVQGIQYDAPPQDANVQAMFRELEAAPADLAIFLEVMPRNMMEIAPVQWAFLNPEWCVPETCKLAGRHMDKIFAKTREAERIFKEQFGLDRVHYTGFLARDLYDPTIERKPIFLHLGGNSSLRGTQAVIDAYRWEYLGAKLEVPCIIIGKAPKTVTNLSVQAQKLITFIDQVSHDELVMLMNQCAFHIYPSGTEGFGHALHEALGVGAVVLTTGAAPMNEHGKYIFEIPTCGVRKINLADVWDVSAIDTHMMMKIVATDKLRVNTGAGLAMKIEQDIDREKKVRDHFLRLNHDFKERMRTHLDFNKAPIIVKRDRRNERSIAFIGNFGPSESTENMIRWALEERLGYDVDRLQENEVNLAAINSACQHAEMLFWVKTPGYLRVRDEDMLSFLKELRIPSVSIHLDKFWGIPEREPQISTHPFWRTKHVCTADGGRQVDFKRCGVNHFWMKPAVSEVYCHPGVPQDAYRCDVGFVGAREYHREYPFREKLVAFLEATYGERFKHITGLRGHGLNDFYASCKVVVGDCIFAGTPRYWSDRVPETCGRGGFMVHPEVFGLTTPMPTYRPQDLDDLRSVIDHYLAAPAKERQKRTLACAHHVRAFDTWTVRLREIIGTVKNWNPQVSR